MSAPSKEQFYQDLNENTFCGYTWCRKLYGFQMYDNAFLERIFARLDELGRGRVKSIYGLYLKWEMRHEIEQMKDAGTWLVKRNQEEREREEREYERTNGDWHGFKGFPSI